MNKTNQNTPCTTLPTIDLADLLAVTGGSPTGGAMKIDPGEGPGYRADRPRSTNRTPTVHHTHPVTACISGAARGAVMGGAMGGPPGAVIGAARGCGVSTILRPLPAY